ncbi:RNA helicase [Bertholletia excelsa]
MVGGEDPGGLPRMTGPAKDFVKGSINNRPFHPGGLDNSQAFERSLPVGASNGEWVWEVIHGGPPQTTPPGFKDGLDLGDLVAHSYSWNVCKDQGVVKNTSDGKLNELSVQFDDLFQKAWEEDVLEFVRDGHMSEVGSEINEESGKSESIKFEAEVNKENVSGGVSATESSVLDEILSVESASGLQGTSDFGGRQHKETWAISGGSEQIAEHFHELVPDMALEFPFELDKFQKEAIYYLEKGDSVFVAAHTSAGKTVVAEYAFALASKHCTRAVYTAPIKTISNQSTGIFVGSLMLAFLLGMLA